jgi:hypothetical protein
LVGVGHRAEGNDPRFRSPQLFSQELGSVDFDVDKLSPWLQVTCKPLHKTGVTIPTTMTTSDVGVDAVVKTGNSRFGQNGFGKDLSYFHTSHYNGLTGNAKP